MISKCPSYGGTPPPRTKKEIEKEIKNVTPLDFFFKGGDDRINGMTSIGIQ